MDRNAGASGIGAIRIGHRSAGRDFPGIVQQVAEVVVFNRRQTNDHHRVIMVTMFMRVPGLPGDR